MSERLFYLFTYYYCFKCRMCVSVCVYARARVQVCSYKAGDEILVRGSIDRYLYHILRCLCATGQVLSARLVQRLRGIGP